MTHGAGVKRYLDQLLGDEQTAWEKAWRSLIRPVDNAAGDNPTLLHLGCRDVINETRESEDSNSGSDTLKSWYDGLLYLQDAVQKPKTQQSRFWELEYGPTDRRKWEGNVALGVIATAIFAKEIQGMRGSQEVFDWAWRAAAHLAGNGVPFHKAAGKAYQGENLFTLARAIFQDLAGYQASIKPEKNKPKPRFGISQAEYLAGWFNGPDARSGSNSLPSTALLVEKSNNPADDVGFCATITRERITGGRGAVFPSPFSFAFVYRLDDFDSSLEVATECVRETGWLDGDYDVCWYLNRCDGRSLLGLQDKSLGAEFAARLWHVLADEPIDDPNLAISATIDAKGNLGPVDRDGLKKKLSAAKANGLIKKVVVSSAQWSTSDFEAAQKEWHPLILERADKFFNPEVHTKEAMLKRRASEQHQILKA